MVLLHEIDWQWIEIFNNVNKKVWWKQKARFPADGALKAQPKLFQKLSKLPLKFV